MTDKKGTGEELGRIEISDNVKWIIYDDGDPDDYIKLKIKIDGKVMDMTTFDSHARKELGDEEFIDNLENLEGDNYESIL